MTQPDITIVAVFWNSAKDVPDFFASLHNQTDTDFHVIAVDNGSTDDTVTRVRQYMDNAPYTSEIITLNENTGFAHGYNTGMQHARSPWVLVSNVDMIYDDDVIAQCKKAAIRHHHVGAIAPKLYRDKEKTILDVAGVAIKKTRQAVNRSEAQTDTGQYDAEEPIFATSAALALYNRAALRAVSENNEYFDEDFFAYKEDLDLSWRLRQWGYAIWYIPSIVAVHARGGKRDIPGHGSISTLKNRRFKNTRIKQWSYRNHLWNILKNDSGLLLLLHAPWFLIYELQKIIYITLFEQRTLVAIPQVLRGLPRILRKRRWIRRNRVISTWKLRHWFT